MNSILVIDWSIFDKDLNRLREVRNMFFSSSDDNTLRAIGENMDFGLRMLCNFDNF